MLHAFRGTGIGSSLISFAWNEHRLGELTAETDADAVDFYERCGFSVRSLGEKYPGTERFWCTLSRDPRSAR